MLDGEGNWDEKIGSFNMAMLNLSSYEISLGGRHWC